MRDIAQILLKTSILSLQTYVIQITFDKCEQQKLSVSCATNREDCSNGPGQLCSIFCHNLDDF